MDRLEPGDARLEVEASEDVDAVETFEELNLKEALLERLRALGYEKPSTLQRYAAPAILNGRSTLIQAHSGTGKRSLCATCAVQSIDLSQTQTQVLILDCTRELAIRSTSKVHDLSGQARDTNLGDEGATSTEATCYTVIGGNRAPRDAVALRQGHQVVVGTPGRLSKVIQEGYLQTDHIKLFTVYEADEMLARGFSEQIHEIRQSLPLAVQVVMLSTTLPQDVLDLMTSIARAPGGPPAHLTLRVSPGHRRWNLHDIRQYYIGVTSEEEKLSKLLQLYQGNSHLAQLIVSCSTLDMATTLKEGILRAESSVQIIDKTILKDNVKYEEIMEQLREGEIRILITSRDQQQTPTRFVTGFLALLNYDIPESVDEFVRQSGREGKFGRKGMAITLVLPHEYGLLHKVEQECHIKIDEYPLPPPSL